MKTEHECGMPFKKESNIEVSHTVFCFVLVCFFLSWVLYQGLQTVESNAVDALGKVSGRSCTASLGRINAGIPLLRRNGDIEDGIVDGMVRSFLS